MGKLDPDDTRPPYLQIADTVRAEIEAGTYAPGAQLPSLHALSAEYEASLGTVKSALKVLREAGLIVTRQGKGSYVRTHRPDEPDTDPTALIELREAVETLTRRVEVIERKLSEQ